MDRSTGLLRRGAVAALTFALAAAVVSQGGTAAGIADQAPPGSSTVVLDGTVAGTGTLGGVADCGLDLTVVFEATVTLAAGGTAELHLEVCLRPDDPPGPLTPVYGRTFVLDTVAGAVSGTVTGTSAAESDETGLFATELTLVATAGTGAMTGATGTLSFSGTVGTAGTPIQGTLSGSVQVVPTSTTSTTSTTTATDPPVSPPPAVAAEPVSAAPTFTG